MTGAMGAAAQSLRVTQPAITRAVRMLEHDLGVRLLDRSRRGSFLTPEGEVLARRTRRLFQQVAAAIAVATDAETDSDAVVRLARKITDLHVRALVAIRKARSFRGAAQALGVAEPSLHRPAREVERLLRTPLYRRRHDGIGLSPAGAELARRFTLGLIEITAGVEEIAAFRGSTETLALGVLALAPKRLIETVVEDALRVRPHARITIQEGSYDELVAALRSGAIDLIFGALRPPPFDDLDEEPLFDDPYCIVCRRGHPLTRVRRLTPSDLAGYDWIFPVRALPRRAMLDGVIAGWKLTPRVQIETNSLGTTISSLTVSDRISLLPREYVVVDDRSDILAVLDIRVPHPTRRVGLTARRDWLPTGFQAAFLDLVRTACRRRRTGSKVGAKIPHHVPVASM